jgi:hypothetical protein
MASKLPAWDGSVGIDAHAGPNGADDAEAVTAGATAFVEAFIVDDEHAASPSIAIADTTAARCFLIIPPELVDMSITAVIRRRAFSRMGATFAGRNVE